MTIDPTVYVNGFVRSGIDHDARRCTPVVDRVTVGRETQIEIIANRAHSGLTAWPAHWYAEFVYKPIVTPARHVVGPDTTIGIRTIDNRYSLLSAAWLYTRTQEGETYCDQYSSAPLALDPCPQSALLCFTTNGEHRHMFTVGLDTPLCTWDGDALEAAQVKTGTQLLGRYGMYVVTGRTKVESTIGYRGNFSSAGGIYVSRYT
jgi:hypothetical protein